MDRDDPYERYYQNIRDEQYWTDRRKDLKDDADFADRYRNLNIQRDIALLGQNGRTALDAPQQQKDGNKKALEELLEERNKCSRQIQGFWWLPLSARHDWCKKVATVDFVNGSRVITELGWLRDEIRDHQRFLWDYGKPRELDAIREALSSLDRVDSLYNRYVRSK
jgi:hypothetical protein